MAFEFKPAILTRDSASFEAVLDTACERLWEKQIRYSLRRIKEMDKELDRLENELTQFICLRADHG